MTTQLHTHLNRFITIDEAAFAKIQPYFELQKFDKKAIIVHAGSTCDSHFFVLRGCLHMYFVDQKGVEKTVQFGIENWWITDYLAFHHQKHTNFYIQAVEVSEILRISYEKQKELLENFPQTEKYFREIYEIAYGAAIMRIKYIFDYSKEEIFYRFRDQFPEFVQRVPQYLVATYLGLTPEYVSKLRSKKRS